MNTITHTYCCQCTDIVSGATGCFIYANDKPFVAISPVFETLVGLYIWMHRNGWECVHEIETPWGCRLVTRIHDKPLAAHGLKSYRYLGEYDWIMIGATDDDDALREARRSCSAAVLHLANLQVWNGNKYVSVNSTERSA